MDIYKGEDAIVNACIRDILQLAELRTFKVVAGQDGLSNPVLHVSYIDHTNELADTVPDYDLPDTLYLTNLSNSYKSEEELLKLFNHLIRSKSSGLIIDNFYLRSLPESVITLCNKKRLPVLYQQQSQIPYSSIIYSIMHYLLVQREEEFLDMEIRNLMSMTKPQPEVAGRVKAIFPGLERYYCAVYVQLKSQGQMMSSFLSMPRGSFVCKHDDALFFVLSSESEEKLKSLMRFILQQVQEQSRSTGISTVFNGPEYMGMSLAEAAAACSMCRKISSSCLYYDQMGLYSFLVPLQDEFYLRRFHEDVLRKIREYDKKYNTEYMNSLMKFVEAGGNYAEAARKLALHVNSVRYRINRIREDFFPDQSTIEFYTNIMIACCMEKLMTT